MIWTMKTLSPAAIFLCAVALVSCEKNAVTDITEPFPGANVKFFNFGVNAPGVNFYSNDAKVTAINSTSGAELTTGTAYGVAGNGGLYSSLPPGQYTFSGKIAAATDKDVAVSKITMTIADKKYYSFYQSGIYSVANKTVDAFVVEDPFPAIIDFSVATVRFVNAIAGSNPASLSVKNQVTGTVTPLGDAVSYKSAGTFTALPAGVYDLTAVFPGAGVATRTAVTFNVGRTYTIGARGDITVVTGTTAPTLDNTANR